MKISNKRICVTGGAKGLGKALVDLLLPQCKEIIIIDRTPIPLRHDKIRYIQMDISSKSLPEIDVDIFISNIAMNDKNTPYNDKDWGTVETLLKVNIEQHLWFLTHAKYSKFVIVGSVLGFVGMKGYSIYCASKSFLKTLSKSLCAEGNDVLIVYPYKIRTQLFDEVKDFMTMEASFVARRIVNAIKTDQKEVFCPWYFKFLCILVSILPRCFSDYLVNKLHAALIKKNE